MTFVPSLVAPSLDPLAKVTPMRLTLHAQQQLAARHIRLDDLAQAIRFGERFDIAGRRVFALAEGCGAFPSPLPSRLQGLVVVLGRRQTVITAYRSQHPCLRNRFLRRVALAAATQPPMENPMSKPFVKLSVRPLSAAAYRGNDPAGQSPYVIVSKSVRHKQGGGGSHDASLLLYPVEVPALIDLLQRLANDLYSRE